jgi:hypothetical protein
MIEHFCKHAEQAVLKPITDSTGQSIYVDEYLGKTGSTERTKASQMYKQLIKKMDLANNSSSLDDWKKILNPS